MQESRARDPDPSRRREPCGSSTLGQRGTSARHFQTYPANFFSGQPSRSCSQRSWVPRATPSGRAHDTAPFPIHSSRCPGQRSREPPAFAPLCRPREGSTPAVP
ncbi:hypothetical protein P7K49_035933, partial [Saguinus oedipus]